VGDENLEREEVLHVKNNMACRPSTPELLCRGAGRRSSRRRERETRRRGCAAAGEGGRGEKWLGLAEGGVGATYISRPQRSDRTVGNDLIQRSRSGGRGMRAASGRRHFWAVPVPGCRAEEAAQARSDARPGPARSTMASLPFRARAGLFRAVSVLAQRAWPIWKSIPPSSGTSGKRGIRLPGSSSA
jgi:hypothetical protein